MISYGPFRAEHLSQLDVQPAQRQTMDQITSDIAVGLEQRWSNTVFKNGRPVLCGGVIEQWPGTVIIWSFVGLGMTPTEFVIAHRYARMFIRALPFRRIEMHVDYKFRAAHRWAVLLGFTCEAKRMRAFLMNGGDASLYARVTRG